MLDFGRSDDARVQAQLDRLSALSVPQGRLGLETIRALMERLGNPHRKLPPVFHIAGTNGKGSVCAFLRAMLEADGKRVHVTTSPHLVRYNERIRIAGTLISDEELAAILNEVLDKGEDLAPSFFEVTIAAAFLAFSRTPADACVVEVGLGGRFDATNVLEADAVAACGIAALGIDHEKFLLAPEDGVPKEPMARIAFEKAGILKAGVPFAFLDQTPDSEAATFAQAEKVGAVAVAPWTNQSHANGFDHLSKKRGSLRLPKPWLTGEHQIANASLAIALLDAGPFDVSARSIQEGLKNARWSARLQSMLEGPLFDGVPPRLVWLDGGHNPSAGAAISAAFEGHLHLVIGMLEAKDPRALLDPLEDRIRSISVVPVPNHDSHPPSAFGDSAIPRKDLRDAVLKVPDDGLPILIAGSLYLAGEALKLNDEIPD